MANIDTEKLVKFFTGVKTIATGALILLTGVAWAGSAYFDTQYAPIVDGGYMKVSDAAMIPVQIKMDNLNGDIKELTLEKRFEKDADKKEVLDAKIEYKKEERDALIKKHSIQ